MPNWTLHVEGDAPFADNTFQSCQSDVHTVMRVRQEDMKEYMCTVSNLGNKKVRCHVKEW